MENARTEAQIRLIELNKRFLDEVESGKGWEDVRAIMEEMKEVAKQLDHISATVITMDNYPLENKASESAQG